MTSGNDWLFHPPVHLLYSYWFHQARKEIQRMTARLVSSLLDRNVFLMDIFLLQGVLLFDVWTILAYFLTWETISVGVGKKVFWHTHDCYCLWESDLSTTLTQLVRHHRQISGRFCFVRDITHCMQGPKILKANKTKLCDTKCSPTKCSTQMRWEVLVFEVTCFAALFFWEWNTQNVFWWLDIQTPVLQLIDAVSRKAITKFRCQQPKLQTKHNTHCGASFPLGQHFYGPWTVNVWRTSCVVFSPIREFTPGIFLSICTSCQRGIKWNNLVCPCFPNNCRSERTSIGKFFGFHITCLPPPLLSETLQPHQDILHASGTWLESHPKRYRNRAMPISLRKYWRKLLSGKLQRPAVQQEQATPTCGFQHTLDQ